MTSKAIDNDNNTAAEASDSPLNLDAFDMKAIAEKPYAEVTPEEKAAWEAVQAKKQAEWEDEWERFEEGAAAAEEAVFAQAPAARKAKAKMDQRQKNIAEAEAKQQEKLQEQAAREYVLNTPEEELSEGDRIRKDAAHAARAAVQVRRNRNMSIGFCFLALAYGAYGVSRQQALAIAAGFVCLVACIVFACILNKRYKKMKTEFDAKNAKLDEYENAHPEYVLERKARVAAKAAESFGLDNDDVDAPKREEEDAAAKAGE